MLLIKPDASQCSVWAHQSWITDLLKASLMAPNSHLQGLHDSAIFCSWLLLVSIYLLWFESLMFPKVCVLTVRSLVRAFWVRVSEQKGRSLRKRPGRCSSANRWFSFSSQFLITYQLVLLSFTYKCENILFHTKQVFPSLETATLNAFDLVIYSLSLDTLNITVDVLLWQPITQISWLEGRMAPQTHAFEFLVPSWWNYLRRIKRHGLAEEDVLQGEVEL